MSIIQRPKRITSESVKPESRDAIDTVGSSVNNFMEEVYLSIMKGLTITDNLNMELKTITLTVDSNGIPTPTVTFKTIIKTRVQGLLCIRVLSGLPLNQPFLSFTENNGIVTLTHITGLTANTNYQIVILVLGS